MSKLFPPWCNRLPRQCALFALVAATVATGGIAYYATPRYTRIGYAPTQPVAFDHALHAGQLGLNCIFCHTHVEVSEHANVPATSTCMGCHGVIKRDNPLLAAVRASHDSGGPIPWVRIHKAPDYVFFNHAVHVNRGISCLYCHGRVDEMSLVRHVAACSMGCCLDCHREPALGVWPVEHVAELGWKPADADAAAQVAREHVRAWRLRPPQSCSGCHR